MKSGGFQERMSPMYFVQRFSFRVPESSCVLNLKAESTGSPSRGKNLLKWCIYHWELSIIIIFKLKNCHLTLSFQSHWVLNYKRTRNSLKRSLWHLFFFIIEYGNMPCLTWFFESERGLVYLKKKKSRLRSFVMRMFLVPSQHLGSQAWSPGYKAYLLGWCKNLWPSHPV